MLPLNELEDKIQYQFKDKKLLARACTHRSFAADHYERLEFLGDSVLNCVVGNALFLRDKHFTEGDLSRVRANLVCEKTLAQIALHLGIPEFLRMGEGERKTGGATRVSIIADTVEAIFGAVFFESGFEKAQEVVLRLYEPILTSLTPEQLSKDAKTLLQEYVQAKHLALPQYSIVNIEGAAHEQSFDSECLIAELDIRTRGKAGSRRAAEQAAAHEALLILKTTEKTSHKGRK